MTGSSPTVLTAVTGTCPFCGYQYLGAPTHCTRCGTMQERAREQIRAEGKKARSHLRFQRALSDLFFLIGLLLGGPMMTLGGEPGLGLMIILVGGVASVLRRYTDWSTPGTVAISILTTLVVASVVVELGHDPEDEGDASEVGEEVRLAYVQALEAQDMDLMVESRGLGAVAVWFHLPQTLAGECGSYPAPEVRAHLAELGFLRVVVADRNRMGGLCSFRP